MKREVNANIESITAFYPFDNTSLVYAFIDDKMAMAVKRLKSRKAQGPDQLRDSNAGMVGELSHGTFIPWLSKIWY